MTEPEIVEGEKETLSRTDAKNIATDFRGEADPFVEIYPSLLSAEHIEKYVLKTGLISPFFRGKGTKTRLKKAAYEGRIGTCAFRFDKAGKLVEIPVEKEIVVPANSIVFVECDLDFRIPEFIALRFNLQIRHVHRGLLLGTGPLVDPGYWGKLCIPLHNLTDADYLIPKDEGLIWIEFTKTTSNIDGADAIGREPLGGGFWDIKEFIAKASTSFEDGVTRVPIRSSIPIMVIDAEESSRESANSAKSAQNSARNTRNIGSAVGAGVIITVLGLWASYYFGTSTQIESNGTRVTQIQRDVAEIVRDLDGAIQLNDRVQLDISTALDELREANSRILELERKNNELTSAIEQIQISTETDSSQDDTTK